MMIKTWCSYKRFQIFAQNPWWWITNDVNPHGCPDFKEGYVSGSAVLLCLFVQWKVSRDLVDWSKYLGLLKAATFCLNVLSGHGSIPPLTSGQRGFNPCHPLCTKRDFFPLAKWSLVPGPCFNNISSLGLWSIPVFPHRSINRAQVLATVHRMGPKRRHPTTSAIVVDAGNESNHTRMKSARNGRVAAAADPLPALKQAESNSPSSYRSSWSSQFSMAGLSSTLSREGMARPLTYGAWLSWERNPSHLHAS
jgi:hypothetical protein